MTITSIGEAFDYPEELRSRIQRAVEELAGLRSKAASLLDEATAIAREDDRIDRATGQGLEDLGLDMQQAEAVLLARMLTSPMMALTTSLREFETDVMGALEPAIVVEEAVDTATSWRRAGLAVAQ